MGVGLCALNKDSLAVEPVDAHLARGVDDTPVAHTDAYVDNATFGVAEEGEVVALYVAETHLVADGDLLRGVAWEPDAQGFEAYLSLRMRY